MATIRKFVVSSANVYGHAENGDILFVGKTLLDSSLEASLSSTDVRAGRGNALQYTFYHSAELTVQVSDAQWNLDLLARNVGSEILVGDNVFFEESVTLGAAGAGTVTKTPVALFGTNKYGWITLVDGTIEKVTFSGSGFSCSGSENDVVVARYYVADAAARSMVVRSDMVPAIAYLVMEAQLCSSDVATNVIGKVEIRIPRASFQGSFSLSMTPDGVASTPLSVRALESIENVDGVPTKTYAIITEQITAATWQSNVTALAITGGDFTLASTTGTRQLQVRAITSSGSVFTPPYADLTFASSDATKATVGDGDPDPAGLVRGVAQGTTTVKVTITSTASGSNPIDATCVVTVPGA